MPSPRSPKHTRNGRSRANAGSAVEVDVIARMTRVIATEWDADLVLRSLVREMTGLLGTTGVVVWLTDVSSHDLTLAYSCGVQPEDAPDVATLARCSLGVSSILSRAAKSQGPLAVAIDSPSSERDPLLRFARAQHFSALLLVPLLAHGGLLGILCLGGSDCGAFASAGATRIAGVLGDLFALAIESTGLQERLRETNARLVAASIEAQQQAEELAQEKEVREAFISLVAHELKNPLSVIKMHIALLQRGGRDKEQQAAALATMANNVNQLQRLIGDLLDASRIAAGQFPIEPSPVDLVAIAHQVAQEQQTTTQHHQVRVLSEQDELMCFGDRQRLVQALSNLVGNAIKYSPHGGDIRVHVTSDDGRARLTVEDEGTGLSPDDLTHIFEPYARLLRVREAQGTGLGLFITKGIVEAHGGTIAADSPGIGHGSIFSVVIPRTGIQAGSTLDGRGSARAPE